ncbi:MAG: class I SAM-dependent methyltransferase [Paracoccaceae bacterium]
MPDETPDPAARWTARYASPDYVYGETANDFLREKAHLIPPGPVLCVADGEGRNGVWLAERGHAVTSVDIAPTGIEKARRLARRRNVRLNAEVADMADYAIEPRAWSGIVWIFAHLPPPVRERALAASVEGLAPGGVLLLEGYTPDQVGRGTGGPPDPALTFDPEALRPHLDGLEILHFGARERDVHEGRLHTGRAAVVQAIARRPGD